MKALQELVDYLFSRGLLSSQEKVSLAARGFLVELPAEEAEEELPEDPYEEIEASLVRPLGRRGGRGGRPKSKGMSADEIDRALSASIASWDAPLSGLIPLARCFDSACNDWRSASRVIAKQSWDSLPAALRVSLSSQDAFFASRFASLWEAIAMQSHFDIVEGHYSGFDVVSYRRLLSFDADNVFKKYGWILRYDSVQDAFNFVKAEQKLLLAFKDILDTQPELWSQWLQKSPHPLAFWVMVFLYNAELPSSRFGVHRTRTVVPDLSDASWKWAWTLASWFLPGLSERLIDEEGNLKSLACPIAWRKRSLV